jgi:hypothetical protein
MKDRDSTLRNQRKGHVLNLGSCMNTTGMDCEEKLLFLTVKKARFLRNLNLSEIRLVILLLSRSNSSSRSREKSASGMGPVNSFLSLCQEET